MDTVCLDLPGDTGAIKFRLRLYATSKRLWDLKPETAGALKNIKRL